VPVPDDGYFHRGPVVMQLPGDATIEEDKALMIGIEKNVLIVKWFPATGADADVVENFILDFGKDFDDEMQLSAKPIAVATMPNAKIVRVKEWFDPENDWTVRLRVGCSEEWCVSMVTFTSPQTVRGHDMQRVEASLGLVDP
jgi:hypothetical protein